jgi:hypothetical protein
MRIYKAEDLWHRHGCVALDTAKELEQRIMGSIGPPDPPRHTMCPICFLFKNKLDSKSKMS